MALSSTNNSIQQGYGAQGSPIFNTFPSPIIAQRDPTTADLNYKVGRSWVNTVLDTAWMLGSKASGSATWIALGSGTSGGVITVTASSGGALSPAAGNISIVGTANQVTTAGAGSTVTISLPAAITAPGSLTTTTTLAAGTTVTAGTSITATLGNITATNGNIVRGTAGNKDVYTSVASTTTAGANSAGTVTLVGGTATISTTAVTASSQIRLYRQGVGATGAAALGILTLGTVTAATSFIVNAVQPADATALQASDVSVIAWEIVN